MSLSDPLGDLLTRIRNGQRAKKAVVTAPFSTLRMSALAALQREGHPLKITDIKVYHGIILK